LKASASYKPKVGQPRAQTKLIIYQVAVKSAVEILRARIIQQIYINGKCEFLVDSQTLKCTNKARFREELPFGSWGSKNLITWESSFTIVVVFQLLQFADANLHHVITHKITVTTCSLLKCIQVSHRKVKV
jgi:hypothetical protein